MSHSQGQASGHPGTLELDGAVQLAGRISGKPGGMLEVTSTRVLSGVANGKTLQLPPGSAARLTLNSVPGEFSAPETAEVILDQVKGRTLLLSFREPESPLARSYLDLLPGDGLLSGVVDGRGTTGAGNVALNLLQEQSLAHLEQEFQTFLQGLSNHLFDLSAKSQQASSGHNVHYEAMNLIKRQAPNICTEMIGHVRNYYEELTPADNEDSRNQAHSANLGLLDINEFEDHLALDRIIGSGQERYNIELESLVIRLAEIIDADPNSVRLPMHVSQLCHAFQHSLESQEVPQQAMGDIYQYFSTAFVDGLGGYYQALNQGLRERGIRPDVEQEIQAKGSLLRRPGMRRNDNALTGESTPADSASPELPGAGAANSTGQPPGASGSAAGIPHADGQSAAATAMSHASGLSESVPVAAHATDLSNAVGGGATTGSTTQNAAPAGAAHAADIGAQNLYQSVIDALNFKREAEAPTSAAGSTAGAAPSAPVEGPDLGLADAGSLSQVLSHLQRDSLTRSAVRQSPSLREYLATNRSKIEGLEDTTGLTPDSLNQLDLVDNLFGAIRSQLDVMADLKPVLGNLQIPLARLALQEPEFFLDRNHVARGVLDKLATLTNSANFPNRTLEGRITRIIDSIVEGYEDDNAVFDDALTEVDKLVAQQERALSKNVERVVKTQEGSEKLERAKQAVANVLRERLQPPAAPTILVDLVEAGWRDLLILTHIKEGPESKSWQDHLKTLDILCDWLAQQLAGDIDSDVQMQRALEAGTLIDLISQQLTTALPTNLDHEPVLNKLRSILAGQETVETTAIEGEELPAAEEPQQLRSRINAKPRLRRWVNRVEQLKKGTWLTYRGKDGQKRRMQLAWISENKDRFIFVNERGQKLADLSAVQLARQLSRGVHPPKPADKLSLIDQSMYDTLEHVQKSLSFTRNHDSLTRLINRETFVGQLQRALHHAQRKGAQHALLCLNIDQFSLVNEVYDEVTGDEVLTEFARLLAQLHSKKSSSARIQDDEFAVLLLDRTPEQAVHFAEKIRSDIEASSVELEGEKVTFSVSIGVMPVAQHSEDVEELMQAARNATSLAKDQGRNRVVLYEEEHGVIESHRRQQALAKANIEQTLETDHFALRAQPIVKSSVQGGEAAESVHFELLLTLVDGNGNLTSPQEFILSAERYGYMTMVDRWVVKEAFTWVSQLVDAQKVVPHLSINLSGTSVTDDEFLDYLLEQISEFGVGTSRLCFEITETGTISNLVKAADFVRTFRNIGCKFSIDDFGTGLASHNYLRELPVDYVKIDGTFITNIHENRTDYAMARSINDLAHFLGQETIAESVENDAIIEKLQEIGVDYLQGWGIGKPKLLSDVTLELASIET